jgi:hypothetical protein
VKGTAVDRPVAPAQFPATQKQVSAFMTQSRPAALIVEDHPFIGMVASDILQEVRVQHLSRL